MTLIPAPDPDLVQQVLPNASSYRASGEWDDTTLATVVEAMATTDPTSLAVVDRGGRRRFSYADLDADADRFANYLCSIGVIEGDVVAVQAPNWYETVVVDLGVIKAAAVLNPMLPIYREKELRYMLELTEARLIVTPGTYRGTDHLELVGRVLEGLSGSTQHLGIAGAEGDDGGSEDFLSWLWGFPARSCGRRRSPAAVSEIIFTSGTEADPKAIMHTEETASANIRATSASLGLTSTDVAWMPSPIGHSTGFNFGVRIALSNGMPLILQDRWDPVEAAHLVETEHPTYTVAATTFLSDLVRVAKEGGHDVSSLRIFGCGGAPVPPHLVADGEAVGIEVLRLYGQTEVLLATWNRPGAPREKRLETDGSPIDGVEVEIRDDDGAPLPRGEEGEIFVRSSGTCVGFFRDPERTAGKFVDGWVRTGDLGVLDADGYLRIVGRKSEIIIRGGMNITPREIEDQMSTLPGIRAVAVIGLPDDRLGEMTCACVVLEEGCVLDLETVAEHLRGRGMATYKLPQRLEVVDDIPMTSTGKVQRHLLTQRVSG